MSSAWCGRRVLYSSRNASTTACASSMLANGPCSVRHSSCRVWCQRSIFPVVVGDRNPVSRCSMPFLRQIRSNNTSAGRGLLNLPVNCLPLSLSTWSGQPYSTRAAANARHTARPVPRRTTLAITACREWSSSPVTTLSSVPSASHTDPVMSICHRSIGAGRSQALYDSRDRRRDLPATRCSRTSTRYTVDRDGSTATPRTPSS
jgi:hypothetical protein